MDISEYMARSVELVMDSMRNRPEQERRALQEFWFECDDLCLAGVPDTEWYAWCQVDVDEDYDGNRVLNAVPKYVEMRRKSDQTVLTELPASMLRKNTFAEVSEQCTEQLRDNP